MTVELGSERSQTHRYASGRSRFRTRRPDRDPARKLSGLQSHLSSAPPGPQRAAGKGSISTARANLFNNCQMIRGNHQREPSYFMQKTSRLLSKFGFTLFQKFPFCTKFKKARSASGITADPPTSRGWGRWRRLHGQDVGHIWQREQEAAWTGTRRQVLRWRTSASGQELETTVRNMF